MPRVHRLPGSILAHHPCVTAVGGLSGPTTSDGAARRGASILQTPGGSGVNHDDQLSRSQSSGSDWLSQRYGRQWRPPPSRSRRPARRRDAGEAAPDDGA